MAHTKGVNGALGGDVAAPACVSLRHLAAHRGENTAAYPLRVSWRRRRQLHREENDVTARRISIA